MTAFYNENDRYPAAWLRNLVDAGHIAPGVVDERSIVALDPEELRGYTQAHFFAGIGVWSHALRLAGWADDDAVWTGSCPCQPFSVAGKGLGAADKRHLWPEWLRLIRECLPSTIFGEQVAGGAGRKWLARVRADLETLGYAVGAADLCAAGVGAPHVRSRLFWCAELWEAGAHRGEDDTLACNRCGLEPTGGECGCPHGEWKCLDCGEWTYPFYYDLPGDGCQWCGSVRLADPMRERGRRRRHDREHAGNDVPAGPWADSSLVPVYGGGLRRAPNLHGSLANGATGRVGRLRAYGNAIVAPLAAEFVAAFMDTMAEGGGE